MKKIVLMVLVAMVTLSLSAQKFGVKGGLNLSSYYGSDANGAKSLVGFQIGGLYELPLSGGFYLQPEALITLKGAKYSDSGITEKIKPFYLEIPIRGMYKLNAGPGRITLAVGPYLALGLAGKESADGNGESQSFNLFTKNGDEDAPLKRFDLGISPSVGYEMPSGLFFNIENSTGFLNVSKDGGTKNTTFTIAAGFKF